LATILSSHNEQPSRNRDDRPLMDAVAYQLSLLDEARRSNRQAIAAVAGARAALGSAILGDRSATIELIDRIQHDADPPSDPMARSMLLEAAMTIGDAGRARVLLPHLDDTPDVRLEHAAIDILEGRDTDAAVDTIDEIIAVSEAGPLQERAAALRLRASHDPAVPLDRAVADLLGNDGPRHLAATDAARALAEGNVGGARSALAGFEDPYSLAERVFIAEAAERVPEAIGLQAALVRKHRTTSSQLKLAALRGKNGDVPGAIRDGLRVATDDRKLPGARDAAYELASQAAIDGAEWEELEDITERWVELSPHRTDPQWTHAFALARQNRHTDALNYVRGRGLEPTSDANRHVFWAELLSLGEQDVPARIRALMDLSDQFDRPEPLEAAFIGAVLSAELHERDRSPEVIARFQDAISKFNERFANSNTITKVTVDDDDDGDTILAKITAVQGREKQEHVNLLEEHLVRLRQGKAAVAQIAALAGRGTVETLIRNQALPLASFDRDIATAEIAAAGGALDQASASWDETALVTFALLDDRHASRLRALLPNSQIGQSVRDAIGAEKRLQLGGEQVATMRVLPDGTPRIVEEDPDTVQRVRDTQTAADKLAGELHVLADPPAKPDDRLTSTLADSTRPGPLPALVSALVAARDRQLPLFSDDRAVRGLARSMDIAAFGTIALVGAAVDRNLFDMADAAEVLTAVLNLGVWGAALDVNTYVHVARRADFDPERRARALLADQALLAADNHLEHNAALIRAVAAEAPDHLDRWAELITSSYVQLAGLDLAFAASMLVAAVLDPNQDAGDDEHRRVRSAAIRAIQTVDGIDPTEPLHDPLATGANRWLQATPDAATRQHLLEALLALLDDDLQDELRAAQPPK